MTTSSSKKKKKSPSSEPISSTKKGWSAAQSAELYGIDDWGHGYFHVSRQGDVTVRLEDSEDSLDVSLKEIVDGLGDRGTQLPVLLRFRDLLHSRIAELNNSFHKAIKDLNYKGSYRGVYPIKVNQQRQVIEEIT
jgi:arginine decarboxylase